MNAIFGILLLAHLIGDYPLQTDWLISVKRTWWGLSLHAGVHLLMLVILAGSTLPTIWLYLVGLVITHYIIDYFKNWLSNVRPRWINGLYIFDQFLHFLSLIAIALWIDATLESAALAQSFLFSPGWVRLLIGLTFCTVVWYISERVLNHSRPDYQREIVERRWARIALRASLFALFLWLGRWAGFAVLPLFVFPYPSSVYRGRAIVTDVTVALISALLVIVAR